MNQQLSSPRALYLHIPFCVARCDYCDFNSYAGLEALYRPYVAALIAEIRRAGSLTGRPETASLFIGGGTPTVLPPSLLGQVVSAAHEGCAVTPDAEISCETNPGTLDSERFAALRDFGVNRLSMGVQSLDDAELRWLGRIHDAAQALRAFESARQAGFRNINLDLMFGIPWQTTASWRATLREITSLQPEHLSLYALTVEPGTPLSARVRRGATPAPEDDLAAELYEVAEDELARQGYDHYEISNWSRPGFACRHNLVYWRDEEYLGCGAGAHSYVGERRCWNVARVEEYIRRIEGSESPEEDHEQIDRRLAMGEAMMLGLRLLDEGVSDQRFRARFGVGLEEVFAGEVANLVARGLIERTRAGVRLTREARLLGNQVFAEFLPDEKT